MKRLSIILILLLVCLQLQATEKTIQVDIFKAAIEKSKVVLKWVINERKARCVVIEKSMDGINFRAFKRVHLNSRKIGHLHKSVDRHLAANKIVYYRLKLIINKNHYIYSHTNTVKFKVPTLKVDIYPKLLMHGDVHVWLNQLHSRKVLVYAINTQGNVIYHQSFNTRNKSRHEIIIPHKLLKGSKIQIHAITDQGCHREKILIKGK